MFKCLMHFPWMHFTWGLKVRFLSNSTSKIFSETCHGMSSPWRERAAIGVPSFLEKMIAAHLSGRIPSTSAHIIYESDEGSRLASEWQSPRNDQSSKEWCLHSLLLFRITDDNSNTRVDEVKEIGHEKPGTERERENASLGSRMSTPLSASKYCESASGARSKRA